ncbi:hypothetical protein SAMN05443428_104126 [Caloramator quimbayensis]|uniref:Uncharacterized protein n=1 Tax=Caloramator quimbayensis TaxID=1147123 RepID=A0A1T4WWX9_9CLOT|nr:hypothetical protein [Caloramator quimbayensis]SKA81853.1 hypothetical protein SAMN05443428_104126 [Caloramator quimbayensis]
MLSMDIISICFNFDSIDVMYAKKTIFFLNIVEAFKIKSLHYDITKIDISNIVKEYIAEKKINPIAIRWVLRDEDLFKKYIVIPYMNKKYIEKNVHYEIEKELCRYFKYYNIYFKIINSFYENHSKKLNIKAFAVPKSIVDFCVDVSKDLGVKTDIIEPKEESRERTLKNIKRNKSDTIFKNNIFVKESCNIDILEFASNIGILLR